MSEAWKQYCANPSKVVSGNDVDLLTDGAEAFPAMITAIEGAQRFISLETYIFQPDAIGTRFRDVLSEAAQRGIEVRLIFDSIGAFETSEAFWRPLREAGGQLLEFHHVAKWRRRWPDQINRRDHRKLLVVDGNIGFCGGINIHDEELPESEGGANWRDVHVRIRGPVVGELHRLFLDTWHYEEGPPAEGEHLLSHHEPAGDLNVYLAATNALKQRRTIHRSYLHAINTSKHFIYLWNPYFIPERKVRKALRNAALRGVDIRIIVPARGDIAAIQFASRKLFARLMRDGVHLYEWREHVMHAKCGVIDRRWSTVGSFNLDHRSLLHNLELNAMIYGEEFGGQMVEMFREDIKNCAEVDRRAWKYRPLIDRGFEELFYLFRYWL